MSTLEHIYIDAGESTSVLAERLSLALGMSVIRNDRGEMFLGRAASNGHGKVGGQLYSNHEPDAEPSEDEFTFTDSYPTVFEVGHTGRDPDVQRDEALRLFNELSSKAPFRMALVSGFDMLVAVADLEIGTVMLPAGTTPYAPDRRIWLPYTPVGP